MTKLKRNDLQMALRGTASLCRLIDVRNFYKWGSYYKWESLIDIFTRGGILSTFLQVGEFLQVVESYQQFYKWGSLIDIFTSGTAFLLSFLLPYIAATNPIQRICSDRLR